MIPHPSKEGLIENRTGLVLAAVLAAALSGLSSQARAAGEADGDMHYPVWSGSDVHLANELGYFKEEEDARVVEILDDDMPNAMATIDGDIDCYLRTVSRRLSKVTGRHKDTQGIIIGTIDLSTGGDGWAADKVQIESICNLGQRSRSSLIYGANFVPAVAR